MYWDNGRAIPITANPFCTFTEVTNCTTLFHALHKLLFPDAYIAPTARIVETDTIWALSDAEIIRRLQTEGRNATKMRQLWSGDWSNYTSPSQADLALCVKLAYYTRGDKMRIDWLYRQSGLYRNLKHPSTGTWSSPKWDLYETYRESTLTKAIDCCTQFFEPPQPRKKDNDHELYLRYKYNAERT